MLGVFKGVNPSPGASKKSVIDEKNDEDENNISAASDRNRRNHTIETKNKLSLKNIVQNILKNTKNIFTKEESNQPNDMLLRTIVIKKLILYLILVFIALSSAYLGYVTVYKEYQSYSFKAQSLDKITKYHNLTSAVLSEYMHKESINARPLDASYTSSKKTADLDNVKNRISTFKNELNSFDIDINVREDMFFRDMARSEVDFKVRYQGTTAEVRRASKYTILMIMLEKVLTMDNSEFDRVEALNFVYDNYLHIINRYFLDSFDATRNEANSMTIEVKVYLGVTRTSRLPTWCFTECST